MAKILVVYHSVTGNTAKMAESVAKGSSAAGAETSLKSVENVILDDLTSADGIIIGSPTYYGQMSSQIKRLFDGTATIRGRLEDKFGAAFTSSGSIDGGNQTTLLSIIQAMLIHGMIVVGDPMETGGHYGATAIGEPNPRALETCWKLGERVARLAARMKK